MTDLDIALLYNVDPTDSLSLYTAADHASDRDRFDHAHALRRLASAAMVTTLDAEVARLDAVIADLDVDTDVVGAFRDDSGALCIEGHAGYDVVPADWTPEWVAQWVKQDAEEDACAAMERAIERSMEARW